MMSRFATALIAGLVSFAGIAQAQPSEDTPADQQEIGIAPPPGITNEWVMQHYRERTAMFAERTVEPGATVMLGDSITEGGDWPVLLPDEATVNFGISGDIAEGVSKRLDQVIAAAPARVFLLIGTNDLPHGLSPEEIGDDVAVTLDRLMETMPADQVYVQSVLPREAQFHEDIVALNQRLEHEAYMRGMWFVYLHDEFLAADGQSLEPSLTTDGLHLNEAGYARWADILTPYLAGFPSVPGTDIAIPSHYPPGGKIHYARRAGDFAEREVSPGRIAFVGDSITEGGDWTVLFPARETVNFGIGWDQTSGLLRRMDQIEAAAPSQIVLLIGTNDLGNGRSVAEAAENTQEIIQRMKVFMAPADILLQSVMPRQPEFQAEVLELNARLERIATEEGVEFLDLYESFLVDDGLDPAVTEDSLHLTEAGYQRWRELLAPHLKD